MKKKYLHYFLIFLITFIFLWFFFRNVNWAETWRALGRVNVPLMVATIILIPLHLVTRSIRWKYLLWPLNPRLKLWPAIEATTVGFTVTMIFPGRVGELVRPIYLARKERMSAPYLIGTIVVERTFDIFSNCFLLGLFLLAEPLYASYFQTRPEARNQLYFWGKTGLIIALFLFLVIVGLYFLKDRARAVIKFIARPFPEKFRGRLETYGLEFIEGLKFFHSPGRLLGFFLLSLVVWLGICFFYWVFFLAYGLKIPYFLSLPYVFLTGVGASIPTPGMAGGFDYFSKLGLTALYGADQNLAAGMTIVIHSAQILVTCLLGYVILWKSGLTLLQVRSMGEGKDR